MTDQTETTQTNQAGTTEPKTSIIEKVTHPLGLFALIVLVAEAGLGVTASIVKDDKSVLMALILGMIALLFAMIIIVGVRIDKFKLPDKTKREPLLPTFLLEKVGAEGFVKGGETEGLNGRWQVSWKQYDQDRNLKPYTIKDPETGEEKPYPDDIVHMKIHMSVIAGEAHDQTTKRIYYFGGRISTANTMTLLY